MPLSSDVVVVGSIMQDLTFSCANFPARGETIVGRLTVGQGGKGSNQAIAAGRAGARTAFVGAMGAGPFTDSVRAFYRRERIACHITTKPRCATGTAVILINGEGQNQIVIEPGANERLALGDIPKPLLNQAQVVVVQLESKVATTARILKTARAAGVTTLLNPAPMRLNFDPALLRDVDILVPNETEFEALVRCLPQVERKDAARPALSELDWNTLHALCRDFGVPTLIVTLGRNGCFVSQRAGYLHLPAHAGVRAVDTTGAGDAFCGGFAAGLVRYRGNVEKAARLGGAVAALSITKPGAAAAMPTQAEIRRFLRNGACR